LLLLSIIQLSSRCQLSDTVILLFRTACFQSSTMIARLNTHYRNGEPIYNPGVWAVRAMMRGVDLIWYGDYYSDNWEPDEGTNGRKHLFDEDDEDDEDDDDEEYDEDDDDYYNDDDDDV
jgi:hypothetical protein